MIWRQTRKNKRTDAAGNALGANFNMSISGLVVEYIVAIDVTRVRFPADAMLCFPMSFSTVAARGQRSSNIVASTESLGLPP